MYSLPHIPIQPSGKNLILILTEAHIEHGRSVLELLQQLSLTYITILVTQVIQIDILIPRRHDEPRGVWFRRELEGGDGIGGRGCHGKLVCSSVSK